MEPNSDRLSILAVNSIETEPQNILRAFKTAQTLASWIRCRILVVTILPSDTLPWPVALDAQQPTAFDSFTSGWLDEYMSALSCGASTQTVLSERSRPKEQAESIINIAIQEGAKALFVITHIREEHHFFGGFLHHLLTAPKIPIFAINAKAPAIESIRSIVFPTDFSPISDLAFQPLVHMAKSAHARVSIIHRLEIPVYADVFSHLGAIPHILKLDKLFAGSAEIANRFGTALIELAKREDVKAAFEVMDPFLPPPAAILRKATAENADLIAMAVKHRRPENLQFGGIVIDVLSKADAPILLLSQEASVGLMDESGTHPV